MMRSGVFSSECHLCVAIVRLQFGLLEATLSLSCKVAVELGFKVEAAAEV